MSVLKTQTQALVELPCCQLCRAYTLLNLLPSNKVIHPKYYKHLKKGAHQCHFGRQKNGLVSGRLASTSSKTKVLNKIGS